MDNLTKIDVKATDSTEVVYSYYTLVHIEEITNCATQGRPLLEEINRTFQDLKKQSEEAYNNQLLLKLAAVNKAAEHDQAIDVLKVNLSQAENKIQELEAQSNQDEVASDKVKDQQAEIEKINKSLEEATLKIVKVTEHMQAEIKKAQDEAEAAQLAEAEIREAMTIAKQDQDQITLVASKVAIKLREANEKIASMQSLSSSSSSKPKASELSNLEKLNLAFDTAMNVSAKTKTKSYQPSIILDDDDEETPNTPARTQRIKIKMDATLNSFKGRPEENIGDWLYTLKRALDSGDYNSNEKLMIATNHLKDIALQDYMLRERMHGKDTWSGFCEYMKDKYTPANQNILIRERIKALKQTSSVEDYYIDFRKLALQSTSMTDEERMSLFLTNLKPSLSKYCFLQECKTLEQCYNTALKKETYSDDKLEPYTTTLYYGDSRTQSNSLPFQEKKVYFNQANNNKIQNSNSNNNYKNNSKQPMQEALPLKMAKPKQENANEVCCICNVRGHVGENCRKHLKCEKCQMNGHTKDDCRQHLVCNKCNRRAHEAKDCYAKTRVAPSFMTLIGKEPNLIRWHAKINQIDGVEVVLDCGGVRSVMSYKLAQSWNLKINKTNTNIETSTGELAPAIGYTDFLEINFEGIISKVSFLITNIRSVDILLGLDWFEQSGVIVDPKNKSFMLPSRSISACESISEPTYNDESDLAYSLNMVCLENDEMEFVDDYFSLDTVKTVEFDSTTIKPECQLNESDFKKFNQLLRDNSDRFALSRSTRGLQRCRIQY